MTVAPGGGGTYTAWGIMSDGSTSSLVVTWSATGGTISSAGLYTAPGAGGAFQVTATAPSGGLTATAIVTVTGEGGGGGGGGTPTLVGVGISPSTVTVAPGGGGTYTAWGIMSDGSTSSLAVTWSTTGGSITSAGLYTAPATGGNYQVTATAPSGGLTATATVTVTGGGGTPTLVGVGISPAGVTLSPSGQRQFTAWGIMSDGSTSTLAVTWSATGGTINPAGLYTAPTTAANYQVRATAPSGSLAATAIVTVTSAAPPPPTLAQVVVSPSSVTLNGGQTRQFSASGLMSDGSTQSIPVNWSATGGSISGAGFYTAGGSSGNYQISASHSASGLSGTASVTISSGSPPPPPSGGQVLNLNFATVPGLSGVGGFFYDCQSTGGCPGGGHRQDGWRRHAPTGRDVRTSSPDAPGAGRRHQFPRNREGSLVDFRRLDRMVPVDGPLREQLERRSREQLQVQLLVHLERRNPTPSKVLRGARWPDVARLRWRNGLWWQPAAQSRQ